MGDLSKHFSRVEFKCQCGECNYDTVDSELLSLLESLREHFGKPILITSGNRCPKHNKKIGGSPKSQHLHGRAADIIIEGVSPRSVTSYLKIFNAGRYGIGGYSNFTHIDTRSNGPARW